MSEETTKEEMKETETPAPSAELTVQDLASIRQIIDVASQRGAFKPNEMVAVGTTYNKLDAFLSLVQAQQAANQGTPKGE